MKKQCVKKRAQFFLREGGALAREVEYGAALLLEAACARHARLERLVVDDNPLGPAHARTAYKSHYVWQVL